MVDIVKDGENGILVQPGDSKSLAEGIKRLLDSKELAGTIASNAYETIRDFYSIDSIASKYMEFYEKL